jgi:hypothetical protein
MASILSSVERIKVREHIDKLVPEIKRIIDGSKDRDGKMDQEKVVKGIFEVLYERAKNVVLELGLEGEPVTLAVLGLSFISSAWTSFALRRVSIDVSREFEERLLVEELLNGYPDALRLVISKAKDYADMYSK